MTWMLSVPLQVILRRYINVEFNQSVVDHCGCAKSCCLCSSRTVSVVSVRDKFSIV